MSFVLPIKHSYVPSWGVWEAVREAMQNGLDEQDQKGHELIVSHKNNTLKVLNRGASLDATALLIGHSTKVGTNLRGQHGEGLNLAMLAATRAGRKMRIETQDEIWTPSIDYSEEYKERVLMVGTRKRRSPVDYVEVSLEITQQEWETYRSNFLQLVPPDDERIIRTNKGSVLLDPAFKGKLFVKGIFVELDSELKYGYDLWEVTLDRDRRVLSTFDKRWEIQRIFANAASSSPQKIGKIVFDLLQNDWEDARGFNQYTGDSLKSVVAEAFQATHGEAAVPVQSIGDSSELDHYGVPGVVVPVALRSVLEGTKVKAAQQVKAEFSNAVKLRYSIQDLTPEERAVLESLSKVFLSISEFLPTGESAVGTLAARLGVSQRVLSSVFRNPLENLEIVEFFNKSTLGLCNLETRVISISRGQLSHLSKLLRVYVHEMAHEVDGSSDGFKGHVNTLEELWVVLHFCK